MSAQRSSTLSSVAVGTIVRLGSALLCAWAVLELASASAPTYAQPSASSSAEADASDPASAAVVPAEESSADDAALDNLLASEEAVDREVTDSKPLNIYGFADFTLRTFLLGEENRWTAFYPRQPRFMVGNLNVYFAKEISARVRSMVEVRFLYLPNGVEQLDGLKIVRTDTDAVDPAEFDRHLTWGGIQIVRAWVEYTFHPLATVRAGQWLTPYGIWNVDHGSPTIIPTRRPYIIGQGLVPEQQTGIMVHGLTALSDRTDIGYSLMLSNGRGPISTYGDLDNNKAVGAHVYVQGRTLGDWRVGAYAGVDKATTTSSELVLDGLSTSRTFKIETQADYLTFAFDARWTLRAFHVQAEGVISQIAYTPNGRPISAEAPVLTGQPGLSPDLLTGGAYLLLAYRLPWLGIMPSVYAEYFRFARPATAMNTIAFAAGVNIRVLPELVAKLWFLRATFPGSRPGSIGEHSNIQAIDAQIAWSF